MDIEINNKVKLCTSAYKLKKLKCNKNKIVRDKLAYLLELEQY